MKFIGVFIVAMLALSFLNGKATTASTTDKTKTTSTSASTTKTTSTSASATDKKTATTTDKKPDDKRTMIRPTKCLEMDTKSKSRWAKLKVKEDSRLRAP